MFLPMRGDWPLTGLLSYRECDSRFKSTCSQCPFAIARAASHSDLGEVKLRGWDRLENVDHARDTPGPRSHRRCIRAGPIQVEEELGII